MIGKVDEYGRALLPVTLDADRPDGPVSLEAWVDTGFTGQLMLPTRIIGSLRLPLIGKAMTRLADGNIAEVDRYQCCIDWFGERVSTDALACGGDFPLLGVALLAGHVLTVDYEKCSLTLD